MEEMHANMRALEGQVEAISPINQEVARGGVGRAPKQQKNKAPKEKPQLFREHMVRFFGPKMEVLELCFGLIYVETKGCPGFC